MAWEKFCLPKPPKNHHGWYSEGRIYTSGQEWVCEVWQSAYGHKANKSTWLYYVGFNPPFELDWSKPKGKYQIGHQDKRGKLKNKPTLSKKEANMTPILFREVLYKLALTSKKYA